MIPSFFMESKTFKIVSLGCRTNQYESQAFRDQLEALGFKEAAVGEEPSLCIVNSCTVTEGADSHSRHEIRKLIRRHPNSRVLVTGCLATRSPDAVKAISGVSHVIPNAEKESLLSLLFPEKKLPSFSIKGFQGHTRAFIKVQDGCNSFCSYCVIPYVRGRSRSRPIHEVVAEVKGLVEKGYKEVVITGINVGDFKGESGERLSHLLASLDEIEGLKRIRLSSIDPTDVDDELLSLFKKSRHLCHSLHLVLQSGSNAILKRMNRKYNRELFLEKVMRLREIDPDFTFTTDLIMGFPGESEEDVDASAEMIQQVGFAHVHLFPYSPREKTRASRFLDLVPYAEIEKRKVRLTQLSEETAFQWQNRFVGRKVEVLTESSGLEGHTDHFILVHFERDAGRNPATSEAGQGQDKNHERNPWSSRISSASGGVLQRANVLPNQLIQVIISENKKEGLIGKIV